MQYIVGFDIGGTKSSVLLAETEGESIRFLDRFQIQTKGTWKNVLDILIEKAEEMLNTYSVSKEGLLAGISCGGPLNSKTGVIMSPPNLPGWDDVHITDYIKDNLGCPARLKNDADACALAEWKYGAGKGSENMIFMTFGTGLGAGLILNGRLYSGTNGNAGEIGHFRLEEDGPVGYGKAGSFEGFCSGGGIRQIAISKATQRLQMGKPVSYMPTADVQDITTKHVAEACKAGNSDALEVMALSGHYLGVGLSLVIDILNPQNIVIGSVFARAGEFLIPEMQKVLQKEALAPSLSVCEIVPAMLGEQIGDYGAIVAALDL
ncbi:MAG: ROK family protein [Clostridia bacterium]|nr:ROK family protein [Clostridia bacterium]